MPLVPILAWVISVLRLVVTLETGNVEQALETRPMEILNATDRVWIYPKKPVITEGQLLELVCATQTKATAINLRWYQAGDPKPLAAEFRSRQNGTITESALKLIPQSRDNGNTYKCYASKYPWREELKESVTIFVKYSPKITVKAYPASLAERGAVLLKCTVHAHPAPNYIKIIKGGKVVSKNFTRRNDIKYQSVLSISAVNGAQSAWYICKADNGFGGPQRKYFFIKLPFQ